MGWALIAGTVLQALVIAAGAVVPAMYALGAIFAALWITGIWLARRLSVARRPRPARSVAEPTGRRADVVPDHG